MTMPQQLSQDEILAQLRVRGFEDGFQGTPLRHFRGKLESITGSMVQRGQMQQARLEIYYNFNDVEVIPFTDGRPGSTEPYMSPIAQIAMMDSNRKRSAMGYLGESINKILNAGLPNDAPPDQVKGQSFLVGKTQEWSMTPGHPIWNGNTKQEEPRECWEVVWVEGFGAPSVQQAQVTPAAGQPVAPPAPAGPGNSTIAALNLLNGMTIPQWQLVVFANPMVKVDTNLINSIIDQQFIPPLQAIGVVTMDANGVATVDLSKLQV